MLLSLQLGSLIGPAYACGCGAMISGRQTHVSVDRETSVVDWDGRTEQIVMRLIVRGDAADAAWIMPVPHRASVELGDRALFSELETLTAPVPATRHHFWPRSGDWPFTGSGDGADASAPSEAAPPVTVVGREQLGPFDVARLAATDPEALQTWLKQKYFELPDRLATALQPYVDQKWEYVAVRLAPRDEDALLLGELDPLRLRFASSRLVYPMRLSKLASTPQSLGLYVLAAHRMEPGGPIGGEAPRVTYAEKFTPSASPATSTEAIRKLAAGRPVFITAIEQSFPRPELIDGDHELHAAAADTSYRTMTYRGELLTVGGVPAWVLTVLGAVLVAAVAALSVSRSRRRRPVPPPPPVTVPPPLA
ncbi:DUF2330 domain-containing protein [Streptomyces sp. NBC_01718]|uniref:DUF2330 domain-containing protein n=1 Tax=Streptomyces sp. NBC_01718 TaxID=2975919 RepID=UPI00352C0895